MQKLGNEASNTYVRNAITSALLDLLKEKSFTEISVSELTATAKVSRNSFYRNYRSMEDILNDYIKDQLTTWEDGYKSLGKDSNAELYGSFFGYLKEHADFYLMLEAQGLFPVFQSAYLEKFGPKPEYANMWAYTTAFIAYGTFGWIKEWMARGMHESAESMARMLSEHGMK